MKSSGTIARVLGFSLLLGGVACSALTDDEGNPGGSQDDALEAQFDKNNVISDEELSTSTMTVGDVQAFFEKTPYGTRSGLASFKEDDRTAAQILHAEALRYKISPIALLARLQLEQGLISKTQAAESTTDIAFGCGCPDSPVCGPKYLGFANQAACAAGSLRRSMDKQKSGGSTIAGWKVGQPKKTQDGVEIVPKNTATAALYTYTPWLGESGGGKTGVGGTSLYFKVLKRFTDAYVIATSSGTVHSDASVPDTGKNPPVDAAPPPPKDAGPVKDGGACGCSNPSFPICDPSNNQCVGCLEDSHCGGDDVCDTSLKKCVECTANKLDNCDEAGKGAACLANKTCGCNADADCGAATSGRACGATKLCQAGCRGTGGNKCPAGQVCSSTGSALGTCSAAVSDAGAADSAPPVQDAAPPVDASAPPPPVEPTDPNTPPPVDPSEPEGPSENDPDLEGHATPASNSAPPPQRNENAVGPTGGSAGPDNDLGRKPSASGCSAATSTTSAPGGSGAGLLLGALGVLVLASSRKRSRAAE